MSADGPEIKIALVDDDGDVETPWAIDLGPAEGAPEGSRRVRLVNVPYFHAKPTWGDVIVVSPVEGQHLTWESAGASYDEIRAGLVEDGGRYALIVTFAPREGASTELVVQALRKVFKKRGVALANTDAVCEVATAPGPGRPGRMYVAAKYALSPETVMARLRAANAPCDLTLVHPVDDPED